MSGIRIPEDIPAKIWVLHEDMADMVDGARWTEPGAYAAFYHIPDEPVELLRTLSTLSDEALFYYVQKTRELAVTLLEIIDREG